MTHCIAVFFFFFDLWLVSLIILEGGIIIKENVTPF